MGFTGQEDKRRQDLGGRQTRGRRGPGGGKQEEKSEAEKKVRGARVRAGRGKEADRRLYVPWEREGKGDLSDRGGEGACLRRRTHKHTHTHTPPHTYTSGECLRGGGGGAGASGGGAAAVAAAISSQA